MCVINDKLYDMECNTNFFATFNPANNPENQSFHKMKKTPWDIIILHMFTKNYDHTMYGSWDMVRDGEMDGLIGKVTYRGGCPN